MLHAVDLHLYRRPPLADPSALSRLDNAALAASQFDVSFEQVAAALQEFERMIFEMDGSFVWTGVEGTQPWQLDGMLYDRQGLVQRVELKGSCPRAAGRRLLAVLGWPSQPLVAHLLGQHRLVDAESLLGSGSRP